MINEKHTHMHDNKILGERACIHKSFQLHLFEIYCDEFRIKINDAKSFIGHVIGIVKWHI